MLTSPLLIFCCRYKQLPLSYKKNGFGQAGSARTSAASPLVFPAEPQPYADKNMLQPVMASVNDGKSPGCRVNSRMMADITGDQNIGS